MRCILTNTMAVLTDQLQRHNEMHSSQTVQWCMPWQPAHKWTHADRDTDTHTYTCTYTQRHAEIQIKQQHHVSSGMTTFLHSTTNSWSSTFFNFNAVESCNRIRFGLSTMLLQKPSPKTKLRAHHLKQLENRQSDRHTEMNLRKT